MNSSQDQANNNIVSGYHFLQQTLGLAGQTSGVNLTFNSISFDTLSNVIFVTPFRLLPVILSDGGENRHLLLNLSL